MAFDAFLKIEGIDGESTDEIHAKWIEISSFSHGVTQPMSSSSGTGGRTGGRADFDAFSVIKTIDTSTPDLNIFCASGKHIPKIELDLCLATGDKHTFMKYTLEDVVVSSVRPGGSAGEPRPSEQISFGYGKIKWEYVPVDQKGAVGDKVDRTWNLELNKQE